MTALLALLPGLAVVVVVLVLRRSGLLGATAAAAVALGLWISGVFAPVGFASLARAVVDALVLELLVAAVIVPGIFFVEVSGRAGAPAAIGTVLRCLALGPARAAILIVTGIGILLESLTGFGVSLLVTVPLLLEVVDRRRAIGLGLVGMSLMPWGALAISAHIGAELAGLTVERLAQAVWLVSGPVAFILPALALVFLPHPGARDGAFAVLAGLVLTSAIWLGSSGIGIEVAGVAGGLGVIVLTLALAGRRAGLGAALAAPALRPYLVLIGAVVAQKLLAGPLAAAGFAPTLATGRVTFTVSTSPGVALLIGTLITLALRPADNRRQGIRSSLAEALQRAWRPLLGIALFMLAARVLVEVGAISALAALLAGLGPYPAVVAVTALGAVSGYVTGSGVIGNALFMPSAAATGTSFDALALFAALQNSAAGHLAMAALPVVAVLLAALPGREPGDAHRAMSVGLSLGGVYLTVLIAGAVVQLAAFS